MSYLDQLTKEELQLLHDLENYEMAATELEGMDLSLPLQQQLIQRDISWITYLSNPHLEVQLEVVRKNPSYCLRIPNPCEETFVEAVKHQPALLSQLPTDHRTEVVCRQALQSTCELTSYAKKNKEGAKLASVPKKLRTNEMIELAIQANGLHIKTVKNPSPEWQRMAVASNPYAIEFIDASLFSEKELLDILSNDPSHLKHLTGEQQTPSLVKPLLKLNGMALGCLNRTPSEEEMEIAFEETPYAVRYFVNPSKGLAFRGLKAYSDALYYYPGRFHSDYWQEVSLKTILIDNQETLKSEVNVLFKKQEKTLDFIKAISGNLRNSSGEIELDLIHLQNLPMKSFLGINPTHILIKIPVKWKSFGTELIQTRQFKRDPKLTSSNDKALEKYLRENKGGLVHIEEYLQTSKLCQVALEQDVDEIKYMSSRYRSYRMFRYAIQQKSELKTFSPYHLSEVVPEIFD